MGGAGGEEVGLEQGEDEHMPYVSAVVIRKTNFQQRSEEANCTPCCEIFNKS